ncbi:hypothetical protein NPIL_45931 [Nephila pilipes]|uniref:Uncharacterized protein n=1 Tax=Nephila pilipes TaxID=299642 RepID=A0A8X6IGP3_NEPPI|nr:hypothetical protein NPIL_45931 [Nephila pilipes]
MSSRLLNFATHSYSLSHFRGSSPDSPRKFVGILGLWYVGIIKRNIAVPSIVSFYHIVQMEIWFVNLLSANRIIPKGMYKDVGECLYEGYLRVITDTSLDLYTQHEMSKSLTDKDYSLIISSVLRDERKVNNFKILLEFKPKLTS